MRKSFSANTTKRGAMYAIATQFEYAIMDRFWGRIVLPKLDDGVGKFRPTEIDQSISKNTKYNEYQAFFVSSSKN